MLSLRWTAASILAFAASLHAQVAVSITCTAGSLTLGGGHIIQFAAITSPVTATIQPNATVQLTTGPVSFTDSPNQVTGAYHGLLNQTFTVNGVSASVVREIDLRVFQGASSLTRSYTWTAGPVTFNLPQGAVSISDSFASSGLLQPGFQSMPGNTDDWSFIPAPAALNTFNLYTDFPMITLGGLSGNLPGGISPQQLTLTPNLPQLVLYNQFSGFFTTQPPGAGNTSVQQTVTVNGTSSTVSRTVRLQVVGGTCPSDSTLFVSTATITTDFGVRGKVDVTLPDQGQAGERGCGNTGIVVVPGLGDPVLLHELPAPASASPGAGNTASQAMTFTFTDPRGYQDLDVVNILVNNFLDGRHACYLAYSRPAGLLFLVPDVGGGLLPGLTLGGAASTNNSQCTVNGAGSSATGSGNTLTLTLNLSFSAGFAGNRVIYTAARDVSGGNSGWQALGTWGVPGVAAPAGPWVGGMSPTRSNTLDTQTYSFTFTDTNGSQDITVANILVNTAIDGRRACYLAFVPSGPNSGTLNLVDDAGDAGGPYQSMKIPGVDTVFNNQCTVSGTGASVSGSGTTLTLRLPMSFNSYAPLNASFFAGNQVFYIAARSATLNSDWQAAGSITIP